MTGSIDTIRGLEPCPFCGGEAKSDSGSITSYGRYWWTVWCPTCEIQVSDRQFWLGDGSGLLDPAYPPRECFARWNRRASSLTASEGGELPAQCPETAWWDAFRLEITEDRRFTTPAGEATYIPIEICTPGTRLRASTAPREYTAETIKDAPEGWYITHIPGTENWHRDIVFKDGVMRSFEAYPHGYDRAFGPIPQPPLLPGKKEGT